MCLLACVSSTQSPDQGAPEIRSQSTKGVLAGNAGVQPRCPLHHIPRTVSTDTIPTVAQGSASPSSYVLTELKAWLHEQIPDFKVPLLEAKNSPDPSLVSLNMPESKTGAGVWVSMKHLGLGVPESKELLDTHTHTHVCTSTHIRCLCTYA